jgi:hypothetical protein
MPCLQVPLSGRHLHEFGRETGIGSESGRLNGFRTRTNSEFWFILRGHVISARNEPA